MPPAPAPAPKADAAKALIKFLHTPEAQGVFKARGLNPAVHEPYTTIITGFSISILNAPINSAPSAPSTAR